MQILDRILNFFQWTWTCQQLQSCLHEAPCVSNSYYECKYHSYETYRLHVITLKNCIGEFNSMKKALLVNFTSMGYGTEKCRKITMEPLGVFYYYYCENYFYRQLLQQQQNRIVIEYNFFRKFRRPFFLYRLLKNYFQ